jgi:hypothetical protein
VAPRPYTLVFRAVDPFDAATLRQALEANGIPTVAAGGQAAFAFGDLPLEVSQVEIWVPTHQAVEAAALIESADRDRGRKPTELDSWTCPACGESNTPAFDLCWSCSKPRRPAL